MGSLRGTRGEQYELEVLERLSLQLSGHVDLKPAETQFAREWLVDAAEHTVAAMREGTLETMELVNGACRLVEMAAAPDQAAGVTA